MRNHIHYIAICFLLALFSCNNSYQESKLKRIVQDSNYAEFKFPPFDKAKILYLAKTDYESSDNLKNIDSLIGKKIIRGDFQDFTFLDTLGYPLSRHYDSLELSKEQAAFLTATFEKCYTKDNPGFPKCGSQIKDAIVFYDSTNKPLGFIEIGFSCGVYYFSKSLNHHIENCNTDSMMNKIVMLFNTYGIKRSILH